MTTHRPSRHIMPLDSREGPALPLDAAELESLATAIGRRVQTARGTPEPAPQWRFLPGTPRWRIAAAVAVVASSAAALGWLPGHGATVSRAEREARPAATSPTTPTLRAPEDRPSTTAPLSLPTASASGSTAVVLEPPASALAPSTHSTTEEPSGLLAQANDLRRTQHWASATATYERILRQFPGSAEAYSARVAAASLRLERLADPAAARKLYRQALHSGGSGALEEEILWGLGRAEGALGNTNAERSVLERLLATHPQTLHAPYAHSRLRELGTEPK
jgi:hypothetical protein